MSEIIECPQCRRKLRMDDSVIGETVQCPSCQRTFVAEKPNAAPPPMPRYEAREQEEPRRYDDNPLPRPRYREEEDDEDHPRRRRSADNYDRLRPHRGGTIQVLGILGLVFCWMPLACLILSISAITMANEDLNAMRRGQMDLSGENATTAGKTCAVISLVVMPCLFLCCCMSRMGGR